MPGKCTRQFLLQCSQAIETEVPLRHDVVKENPTTNLSLSRNGGISLIIHPESFASLMCPVVRQIDALVHTRVSFSAILECSLNNSSSQRFREQKKRRIV